MKKLSTTLAVAALGVTALTGCTSDPTESHYVAPASYSVRTVSSTSTGYAAPMVTLEFDDGYAGQFANARPLLVQYGYHGTFNIITGKIGGGGSMTATQIKALYTAGNEIGSHTVTHRDLTALDPATVDNELRASQATLQSITGAPVTSVAVPYGRTNAAVTANAQQYYAAQRLAGHGYVYPATSHYSLPTMTPINTTSVATIDSWIDGAISQHAWLLLLIHNVTTYQPTSTYAMSTATLSAVLAHLKQRGVKVVTQTQGLALA